LRFQTFSRGAIVSLLCAATLVVSSPAQQSPKKSPAKSSAESEAPAQIELLETRVRFEANGDSRKEVHARVHILNELGAQQFGRLAFDYNRAFQSVEIPQAHISHPEGGTSDILPSAIADRANPATEDAPAYQDVRVKSVRILGLAPGDTLEYRVITTTTHHPLAPDFWFDHNFDRSGFVAKETLVIDLPASIAPPDALAGDNMPKHPGKAAISSGQPVSEPTITKVSEENVDCVLFRWELEDPAKRMEGRSAKDTAAGMGDVELAYFSSPLGPSWDTLSHLLYGVFCPQKRLLAEITQLAESLTKGAETPSQKPEKIYDFVSQKIRTVDLPLGSTGFHLRPATEIASSGYATAEDKTELFMALAQAAKIPTFPVLLGPSQNIGAFLPRPTAFAHILVWAGMDFLDPSLEVAPFRMLPATYRGSQALDVGPREENHDAASTVMISIPKGLPFASLQKVQVNAALDLQGKLAAKVHYSLRGDNELLLRLAFHQTPKEKWKELAQLLSLSDGFRGQVSSVNASDPSATREPFSVDYEITEPKFLDWSKKPLHVPALLPQLGLPDPPGKAIAGAAPPPIDLGTPLEAEIRMTLQLPPGSAISAPTGTSVQRDYATFTSHYSAEGQTATAVRHIRFIARELPADRAFDFNAFLHAVQNDEGQSFILDRQNPATPASSPKP
jgi:hypothetical protein